ncbi:MAG: Omp28-related outer membrane protein [Flavobacteriales bacterium]
MKKSKLNFAKKYFILPMLAISITMVSCKKEDPIDEDPTPTGTSVPSSFTKKVLMEEFTGEWCGFCPDGATIMKNIMSANPGRVYAASIHDRDFLTVPHYTTIKTFLPVAGFPRSAVNRTPAEGTTNGQDGLLVYSRGNWATNVSRELSKTAICGLKLETSVSGNSAEIKVSCGANTSISGAKLTVYLTEDGIPESTSGAQAGAGPGYINDEVLRACVSNGTGDDIDLSSSELATKTYSSVDITGYNKSNLKVVAFIHKHDGSSPDYEVLNVQEVHVGDDKSWD